jgi:uncharacterized protein
MWKALYNAAGCLCVGCAFVGVFLPLIPTTPFLLLAAFLFSRGSPRLHHWLIEHHTWGPIISDWNEKRVVRPQVKVFGVVAVVVLMIPAFVGNFQPMIKWLSVLVGLVVIVMIARQRSA